MKKTSKSFKLIVTIVVASMTIGTLEIFNLHPQLDVGNFHWHWSGIRNANLQWSGTMIIHLTDGKTEIQKQANFGLFTVTHIETI